jgi:ATP-dependent DNA helicase RecQ
MNSIAFIDTEIEPQSRKILDIGCIKDDGSCFHKSSPAEFAQFLKGVRFVCGHNILNHDIKYVGEALSDAGVNRANIIDTLFLSPLLFPTKPYHALVKDDKLQSDDMNNPLNDSIKAKDLFYDEVAAFRQLEQRLKQIFYLLLSDKKEFQAFFRFIEYTRESAGLEICQHDGSEGHEKLIHLQFENEICENVDMMNIITAHPIELAYCLSLINSYIHHKKVHSITPPWLLKNYPEVEPKFCIRENKQLHIVVIQRFKFIFF